MTHLEEQIGRATSAWVDGARRRAVPVIGLALLVTLASVTFTIRNLGMNTDTEAMLASDLPFRETRAELDAAFPVLLDNFYIVIDADSPERARQAAAVLAARLEDQPEHFSAVFVPGGGLFFDENALLYLGVEDLDELADRLARVQPLLAEFSQDPTLAGLAGTLRRAIRAADPEAAGTEEFRDALDGVTAAVQTASDEQPGMFSWEEWILGRALGGDGRRRVIFAQPVMDYTSMRPGRPSLQAVRRAARELGLDPVHGVRVRVTGDPALSTEDLELVRWQAATAGGASFTLVAVLLMLALRSGYLVLSTLVTLIVGLAWTAGFATLAIGHLNMISVTFAVLFIGLGVDFGIHFCTHYRESLASGASVDEALRETGRHVGSSLVICAATTSIGFYAFVPTAYSGIAELGLISGTGMFLSLLATLTVLPALLTLGPALSLSAYGTAPRLALALPRLALRRPRWVLIGAMFVALAAALTLPKVRFDASPLTVRDPSAESVRTMEELLESEQTVPWEIELLAPDLAQARDMARRLESLASVERTITLLDYIPPGQQEKLAILEDISFLLGPLAVAGAQPEFDPGRTRRSLEQLRASLLAFEESRPQGSVASSARALREALERLLRRVEASPDPAASLRDFESQILSDLPGSLRRLRTTLRAREVGLADFPATLRERYLAADGSVRIEVFPSVDLSESEGLVTFVDQVREVAPRATGVAVEIVESSRAIVKALRSALTTAFILITLLLFALWRTWSDTALTMAPLVFAALLTTAATVVTGPPFNYADVIVLPLLLGIGIDSGIHLVHRFRTAASTSDGLLSTSTAHAVLFSGLTTIGSFGTLAIMSHRGMSSLGQLLTIGVGSALVANLFVLPSLLAWRTGGARPVMK